MHGGTFSLNQNTDVTNHDEHETMIAVKWVRLYATFYGQRSFLHWQVRAFDDGNTTAFFALWNEYVPPALLGYDLEA